MFGSKENKQITQMISPRVTFNKRSEYIFLFFIFVTCNFTHIYGLIFRTSIAGRPVVISADPEINNYLIQQEGKLLEVWYLDTFSEIFKQDGDSRTNAARTVHKYLRHIFLEHFGAEILKKKLLTQIEAFVDKTLCSWSSQKSVESIRLATVLKSPLETRVLSEKYTRVIEGLMSFPINFRSTAYFKCLMDTSNSISVVFIKEHKKVITMLKDMLNERRVSPETCRGDFLDNLIVDMEKEEFMTEDFAVQLIFGGSFTNFESVHRKCFAGFTIPAGWTVMVVTSALHMNPNTFKDPLVFNPWHWKNFMPFGGGMRQCAGSEYSRAFLATFLHVLVTKYLFILSLLSEP
ncbi:putative 3-epi-6-deoxocathasterone 23-monooxygenase [Rosa chinensis]|uniref:Putative 3-epi-6-deoxocathasterone 23-monooxygenase n=1 Tax=Rosa chinensis TaxID=74649 RepID=A0A2P6PT81_ROSCH|nr:putative 3-epi-6-deoxocathasterone 23-monooxygenase [Rosa chinensis]